MNNRACLTRSETTERLLYRHFIHYTVVYENIQQVNDNALAQEETTLNRCDRRKCSPFLCEEQRRETTERMILQYALSLFG